MTSPKVDYRDVLTKGDILVMRSALREAIFFMSVDGQPPEAAVLREKFERLLKKINGSAPQWLSL